MDGNASPVQIGDTALGVAAQGNYHDLDRHADPFLMISALFTAEGKLLYFLADDPE